MKGALYIFVVATIALAIALAYTWIIVMPARYNILLSYVDGKIDEMHLGMMPADRMTVNSLRAEIDAHRASKSMDERLFSRDRLYTFNSGRTEVRKRMQALAERSARVRSLKAAYKELGETAYLASKPELLTNDLMDKRLAALREIVRLSKSLKVTHLGLAGERYAAAQAELTILSSLRAERQAVEDILRMSQEAREKMVADPAALGRAASRKAARDSFLSSLGDEAMFPDETKIQRLRREMKSLNLSPNQLALAEMYINRIADRLALKEDIEAFYAKEKTMRSLKFAAEREAFKFEVEHLEMQLQKLKLQTEIAKQEKALEEAKNDTK